MSLRTNSVHTARRPTQHPLMLHQKITILLVAITLLLPRRCRYGVCYSLFLFFLLSLLPSPLTFLKSLPSWYVPRTHCEMQQLQNEPYDEEYIVDDGEDVASNLAVTPDQRNG